MAWSSTIYFGSFTRWLVILIWVALLRLAFLLLISLSRDLNWLRERNVRALTNQSKPTVIAIVGRFFRLTEHNTLVVLHVNFFTSTLNFFAYDIHIVIELIVKLHVNLTVRLVALGPSPPRKIIIPRVSLANNLIVRSAKGDISRKLSNFSF